MSDSRFSRGEGENPSVANNHKREETSILGDRKMRAQSFRPLHFVDLIFAGWRRGGG